MRTFYWYITAYAKKHGWKVLLSIGIGIALFSFLVPFLLNPALIKPRQYIGLIGEFTTNTLPEEIQNELSIGLTTLSENGSPLPGVSDRWTIEQEDKTYRFFLKKDATWQDGEVIKPEDIQFFFPDVQVITTPNDVIFKLPAAYAPFPTLVAQPLFKSGIIKTNFFSSKPVVIGNGNSWISDYKQNGNKLTEVVLEKKDSMNIYRFYKTEDEAVQAFKRGEVDLLPDLNRTFDIMNWPTVNTEPHTDYWNYVAVYFNTRDARLSKNVRQALSYALEKRTDEKRAIGPISPDSWAFLPGGKTYDKDWQRGTERLLDELPGEPLSFELTTTSVHLPLAEIIKTELESFGDHALAVCQNDSSVVDKSLCANADLSISIRVTNFPDLSNFQLLVIGTPIDPDPDQYALWHSDQSTNITGYKNTRIDNLLEKGRQVSDQSERKQIYQEFQQFLQEDPPAIFLEYLTTYEVRRKNPIDSAIASLQSVISREPTITDTNSVLDPS